MSSESAEQSVLVTQERPASSEYVESAKDWPLWSSVTHEDGSGKFHFSYNGGKLNVTLTQLLINWDLF